MLSYNKLYLYTFTINKLQIQTTCKIAELIEAGSMETCLLPNIQYYSNDIRIYSIITKLQRLITIMNSKYIILMI